MSNQTGYGRLVDALRDHGSTITENGHGKAQAQCPAHDDGRASLSVTAIEGSVLVYCHAGCQTADVLTAVGLTLPDLFDEPKKGARYDYPDGRRVHRSPDKQFRQSGNTKGRSLYRVDKLGDANEKVFVVEGEKDVHAIESAGGVAVCPAMGAGKAHKFDWSPLRGKHAVIVADKDEPGRKHAAQVAELLDGIAASVAVVEAATGKDAADHIAAGRTLDDLRQSGGKPAPARRRARVEWASSIRSRRQEWLVENRIPVATASALAGRGGVGKTSYALHWAAQLSNGTLPGKYFGDPRPTLVWSGEDPWDTVLVPRLMALGADLSRVGRLAIDSDIDDTTCEVTPRLPLDVAAIREAIDATGAVLVIIDPIASTMSGDLHREADVRAAVDALARLAETTGAVVIYVRHFGKGGGNASDKMSGSHAFRDAARSVFLFAADDEDDGRVIVTQDKGNYAPPGAESFAYRLENTTVHTDDGPADVARVVDLGVSDVSVDDVINRIPARDDDFDEHDYTADFQESWLYKFLADAGTAKAEVRPKDAVAVGADKGISRRSVFRLFDKLANAGLAESVDGTGFPRATYWRLKQHASDGTTGPALTQAGTTGTTGLDLHKQGGTTGGLDKGGGTTGGTTGSDSPDPHKRERVNGVELPVVPVVPPSPLSAPPGGITDRTPGVTDRVAAALAKACQQTNGRTPATSATSATTPGEPGPRATELANALDSSDPQAPSGAPADQELANALASRPPLCPDCSPGAGAQRHQAL